MSSFARAILVALALAAGGVLADECPPIEFGPAHASLDELAAQTLVELFDDGGRYESGGYFIERDGAFHASRPVTQRAPRAVNYCIVLPRDATLAAIYHTHVASSVLSARDRSNAERAGVPSYIGTIRDRSLWVYDARRREARLIERAPRGDVPDADDGNDRSPSLGERFAALKRRAADALSRLF
jgi:hypothetical protein